ncbi:MAG: SpoIIIAH-like family protein [Clostridia bacterium]|nr:SpoIIIAH-like family protein [Clostridia bacterium]
MENVKQKKKLGLLKRIGKRNLVIVSVMLLIGLAVYLNYLWFYDPQANIGYGDTQTGGVGDGTTQVGGDAEDYFAAALLARESARSESMETLELVATGAEGEEKEAALAEISRIAAAMEQEANIETLIKADGYEKCVAVINGDSASIVVSSEKALDATGVAAITTIVYEQAGILPVNLTVKQK